LVKSYGAEASQKLGVDEKQVFKTIVVETSDGMAVGVIPVSSLLNMKLIAKTLKSKKCAMANKNDVERSTGYILGGVSPLAQKRSLPTVIDISANNFDTIYVSAGKRGLDIEIKPDDLQKLTRAAFANITKE